jgi:imidazolonepropionase
MASLLIQNIASLEMVVSAEKPMLKGSEMNQYDALQQAFLLVENGVIKDFGKQEDAPPRADEVIDASGKFVLPGWCDSHTHLVFAGSRENEFVDKIRGLTYEQIAANGGGILNSAKRLQNTSEELLVESAWQRLAEIAQTGTTSVEIKSGYGLSVEAELKMLRVIKKLKEKSRLHIKATFLGAHAFPENYKLNPDGYVQEIIDEMIPQIAHEGLADFIDVFCDRGFFTPEQTAKILEAGVKHNLVPKLHANELGETGGIETGVAHKARSVDHLEHTNDEHIALLAQSNTMPTLLPSTAFFLRLPYAPARKMIDSGLPVALASDFNPGSSPSGNMPFVLSLSCLYMKMLPKECIAAATLNGAYAMQCEHNSGSIAIGKKADLIVTRKIDCLAALPYFFGSNLVETVIVNGNKI